MSFIHVLNPFAHTDGWNWLLKMYSTVQHGMSWTLCKCDLMNLEFSSQCKQDVFNDEDIFGRAAFCL